MGKLNEHSKDTANSVPPHSPILDAKMTQIHTIADHWEHFNAVDIPADAPPIQRDAMQRAFMAGLVSGLQLAISAYATAEPQREIMKILADFDTWQACDKMKRGGTQC